MTEQTEKPKKSESTSISGSEIILLFLFGPIVLVWLGLGCPFGVNQNQKRRTHNLGGIG